MSAAIAKNSHWTRSGQSREPTCSWEKFEKFCEFFKAQFKVIPLSEHAAGSNAGRDMGGTLSITLDDGYCDNRQRLGRPTPLFAHFFGSCNNICERSRALVRK